MDLGTNMVNIELRTEGVIRNNNTLELVPAAARTDTIRRYYAPN